VLPWGGPSGFSKIDADSMSLYKGAWIRHELAANLPCGPKKTDPLVYFDDNFGKYGPI